MGSVGSIGFLSDFEFYMAVLGVGMGPIGLVAALSFKMLDSQPDSLNMGPVWFDVHDFCIFSKSPMAFWHGIYRVFGPGASEFTCSSCRIENKKNRDEKLCRFVVVSPREVPYSTVSYQFKIFNFLSFLVAPHFCLFQFRKSSVH